MLNITETKQLSLQLINQPFKVNHRIIITLFDSGLSIVDPLNLALYGVITKVTTNSLSINTLSGVLNVPSKLLEPIEIRKGIGRSFLLNLDHYAQWPTTLRSEVCMQWESLLLIYRRLQLPSHLDICTLEPRKGIVYLEVYSYKDLVEGASHWYGSLEDEYERLKKVSLTIGGIENIQFYSRESVLEAGVKVWLKLFPKGKVLMLGKRGSGDYKLLKEHN